MTDVRDGKSDKPERVVVRLRSVDEAGNERAYALPSQPVVVGRTGTADVRIESVHVSRKHAEIYRDPFGRWWVRDLMSRAGTRVNGRDVPEALVTEGDEVTVGEFTLKLDYLAEATRPDRRSTRDRRRRDRRRPDTRDPRDVRDAATETIEPTTAGSLGEADALEVDDSASSITSLDKLAGSRIESIHLATLKEFGDRLLRTPDRTERQRLLCRLLTRRDFRGTAAIALHLERKDPRVREPKPTALCEQQTAAGYEVDMHLSRSLLRSVFESGLPMLATREMSDPGAVELSISWSNAPIVAMACPLRHVDKTMDIVYATFPLAYGDAQWLTLVALAAQQYQQAETVLDAKRRAEEHAKIEEDLTQAQVIQRRYVPENPEAPGLEIAIGFEPCRWVGGDLVDVVRLDDCRSAMVIADVSGKGLPAALITSNVYSMTRALLGAGVDLRTTIDHLNAHLRDFLRDGTFVTLVAVEFDADAAEVQSVNAGHPAPFVVGADGRVRKLPDGPNLPLGITEQTYERLTAPLETGETLVMFTDGLSELRDENDELLGMLRLMDALGSIIHAGRDAPVATLAERLVTYLDETHGDHVADDDRTFLLARRV